MQESENFLQKEVNNLIQLKPDIGIDQWQNNSQLISEIASHYTEEQLLAIILQSNIKIGGKTGREAFYELGCKVLAQSLATAKYNLETPRGIHANGK